MRKLLILALLLYNLVALATRSGNYDYDEGDGTKRHSLIDDRRNWRKKALTKRIEDHKDWDIRRYDFENQRYDAEPKGYGGLGERQIEMDLSSNYRRRYDEDKMNLQSLIKSSEAGHSTGLEKDQDKKLPITMNCERQHERYETCFAGCASVSCDNPRDRLRPCYPFCEPGCICVHPYVRDDRTHKCVLPEDCTKGLKGIPDIGEEI